MGIASDVLWIDMTGEVGMKSETLVTARTI